MFRSFCFTGARVWLPWLTGISGSVHNTDSRRYCIHFCIQKAVLGHFIVKSDLYVFSYGERIFFFLTSAVRVSVCQESVAEGLLPIQFSSAAVEFYV